MDGDLTGWVNLLYQCASLGVKDDSITAEIIADSPEKADVVLVELAKDSIGPRCKVRDVNQSPCICSQPENLHRAQFALLTYSTGDVDMFSKTEGLMSLTRDVEFG